MSKRTEIEASVNLSEVADMLEYWGTGLQSYVRQGSREGVKYASERLEYWFNIRDKLREKVDNERPEPNAG